MKRWENGKYIELSETEKAELAARRAAVEAEERAVAEREAAYEAKLAAFRAKAKTGRVTVNDLAEVLLEIIGQ